MNWLKRKAYPKFWKNYKATFKTKDQQELKAIRFVVFDTETTGLNPKQDRILSIGCVAIKDLKIKVADQQELYLKQELFNAETVKIHGLLKDGNYSKVEELNALELFLNYLKNAVLVAHHAAFDVAMINNALLRHGLPKLKNKVLDTGHLFQKTKLDTSKAHFGLDELCRRFNIPMHDRHTASGDAYITALLFLKLLAKLNKNNNLNLKVLLKPTHRVGLL